MMPELKACDCPVCAGKISANQAKAWCLGSTRPAPERHNEALRAIMAERERQKDVEGWTPEHDDEHSDGSLAGAAMCYCAAGRSAKEWVRKTWIDAVRKNYTWWPWGIETFKPKERRYDLVRAGALIVAEIERLDRLAALAEQAAPVKEGE